MSCTNITTPRILIIDDNPDIHKDFKAILGEEDDTCNLDDLEKDLFGDDATPLAFKDIYDIEHAFQGQEGLQKTQDALTQDRPFMVAFVDMRMPPGWDGLETIERIWQADPQIQVVICTAYSDYSWEQITERLGKSDKLLLLKKPFDVAEIAQLASTLIQKWTLHHQANLKMNELEVMVQERTQELEQTNNDLQREMIERKNAEGRVKQRNEELLAIQQELRDINQHLEEMVEGRTVEIRKLLKQKEEFISQLGHDLRSPLTPMVALVPMLQEQVEDVQAKEFLEVIASNVKYMRNLVEKTVQLATLNSTDVELDIKNINLLKIIEDVLNRKRYHFNQNNVQIKNMVSRDIIVAADQLRLTEVLDNLTSNAVNFMTENGTLAFEAWPEGDFVTLAVRDTGIGLSKEQTPHIFDEFYKADESRHQLGSAGLGLTICQRIVENHGGKIWAESKGLGEGTTFYFTIPSGKGDLENG
ncbi:MAG: hybrid sensor histidine kinase/response regulator [Chloroflexota bacterium]|nr:hybrid sensor histidine kinase/response regulator [Chloroflexota bacterium]